MESLDQQIQQFQWCYIAAVGLHNEVNKMLMTKKKKNDKKPGTKRMKCNSTVCMQGTHQEENVDSFTVEIGVVGHALNQFQHGGSANHGDVSTGVAHGGLEGDAGDGIRSGVAGEKVIEKMVMKKTLTVSTHLCMQTPGWWTTKENQTSIIFRTARELDAGKLINSFVLLTTANRSGGSLKQILSDWDLIMHTMNLDSQIYPTDVRSESAK